MNTVFISGSTGFIGRGVMRRLLKSLGPEDRLLVLVRKPVDFSDERVVPVLGSLESLEKVGDLIVKANYIIHIAGEARLCLGSDYERTNVAATRQLIELARGCNSLQRFIFISSIAVMDRAPFDRCNEPLTIASPCLPRTEYGISKRKAEELILQSNLPHTIFRPGFVYGPGMRNDSHLRKFALLIRKGFPLQMFGFPGRISLIHLEDLAVAIAKCVKSDLGVNRTYLAATEVMRLGDVLSLIAESLNGKKSLQLHVPAMKCILQRVHSRLPVIVAGMFLDYFWMDHPDFRDEFSHNGQWRLFHDNVYEITDDLIG